MGKEGAEVRKAFDGPKIDYDTFIDHHADQIEHEDAASSEMGSARAKRKEFLDETNLHSKAVSAMRVGLKIKKEQDRVAWVKSMKALLPLVEQRITGNVTQDMFEGGSGDEQDEPERDPDAGELADEEAEFNDAVDQVVTPIDFGGARG